MLHQLLQHLDQNNLLGSHQLVYRCGHSCETALLKIVNDMLLALDKDEISLLALLDFSAAFDTIDHSILLRRLQTSFGVCVTLHWHGSLPTSLAEHKECVCEWQVL